jgi:hypothetical protein
MGYGCRIVLAKMIPFLQLTEDQPVEYTNIFVDVRFCSGAVSEADSGSAAVFFNQLI